VQSQLAGNDSAGKGFQKMYFISTHFEAKWIHSRSICQSYGMEIASFESLNEADNFMKLCNSSGSQFQKVNYIGAVTTISGSKNAWLWIQSGKRIGFNLKFAKGEPTNTNKNEYCLSVMHDNGICAFNDADCNQLDSKFICQTKQ